uniref:Longin domain-containing protein n=1 Tax=Kalanchoe fedtschenkoi TaxID=63787 RepID=A0A7N0U611_KALFE
MASDRDLVLYLCVSEGTMIVADVVFRDPDMEKLAAKCLHHTPANHAVYTHTFDGRSYAFLIGERFVVFGIFDAGLEKGKRLWLLEKVRDGFEGVLIRKESAFVEKLGCMSLQVDMAEVFRRAVDAQFGSISSVSGLARLVCDQRTKNSAPAKSQKGCNDGLKKKKKKRVGGAAGEANGESWEVEHLADETSKEMSVLMNKHDGRQRAAARRSWRMRAWIVLLADLIVCLVLFGVWLYICRGFKCLDG